MMQDQLVRTPVYPLRFSDRRNFFYIKRDDLIPFSFGGNKVRIAQQFFNDMYDKRCDCIIAYGDSKSNLCRVIVNMSRAQGVPCIVISPTDGSSNGIQPLNSVIIREMGVRIVLCNRLDVSATLAQTINECRNQGLNPYYIYGDVYGKGNEKVPIQAYVQAYDEIRDYENENGIVFDYIFHASGTGATQSGLICGSLLHQDNREIIGISIARDGAYGRRIIAEGVSAYCGYNEFAAEAIHFEDRYTVGGYGKYNSQIENIIQHILEVDGIPLDPTYTGKAFWGMTEYLRDHSLRGKNVLFIHTGGLPLFFDHYSKLGDKGVSAND